MSQRWGIYLMTVFSLGVLASLFASRGQTIWAVGFAILAAGYLARGIFQQVRENKEHHQELDDRMSGRKTSAEKRAIVDNLLTTRKLLKGRRNSETPPGTLVLVGIVLIYPSNVLLAWAISILFIPLGYLIIKQTRSINLIERGLTERGYSLKPTN